MMMATDLQTLQSKPAVATATEKDILDEKDKQTAISWKPFLIGGAAVLTSQILFYAVVTRFIVSWADRSSFGDMFGAINTLFSGLAFAGVIYAIFLQRRELELQRQELILTRTELKRSAEAQEKSEKALKDQVAELINQRRLSILPGFILHFQKNDVSPSIKNIGSGVALNIRPEPIPLEGRWAGKAILLHPLSHLLPNDESNFALEFLGFGSPEETNKSGIGHDRNATEYLRFGEYEVTISFIDIEGNQYTQKIMMSMGRCRPKIVELSESS
jgi:hypothetical protein